MASAAATPAAWTRVPTPVTSSENDATSPPSSAEEYDHHPPTSIRADDIAIIGIGCRVPGGNNSPAELWEYLMKKGDASGEMPAFRWEPYKDRNPRNGNVLAKTTSKGYFLDRLEDFDATFFSVSPREAEQMDPQQRIALEVAWEALENAGIPPQSLAGSNTSVYMGVNSDDYAKLVLEDLENVGAHMGVGTAYCGIPSRISYLLDLMGPSIAIDAACASSLVAVHQARQAILAGESDLAIAGGVNALIGPGLTRVLDEAGAIADDGKCRSFDDSAHGYGRGEGAGVIILKRLSKALSDGDHVLAVLKGSAVCADGKTVGIMAPNSAAQELVAIKALREAKVPASTISYVEAHATSTPLGDPTETAALARIYGSGARRTGSQPLPIGSIKSSIGHLEAGAGVMSLIKAVMVLEKRIVPPQANLEKPSTKIDWANNMLVACQQPTKLAISQTPPRAAIASYGYSGTVSHAVIEAAPNQRFSNVPSQNQSASPSVLMLSAPQANRIPASAKALADWLDDHKATVSLEDVATTLASRRGHHRFRSCIVADNVTDAIHLLRKVASGTEDRYISNGRATSEAEKGAVWVFSGHGAHWSEMGKELYQTHPGFKKVVQDLEPIIAAELGFSATDTLLTGTMESTDVIQAMTFLMHVGIAEVMRGETGNPDAVVGHSLGEAAAAVVAGAITLTEGALIVCRRAKLYRQVMGQGAMALVSLSYSEIVTKLGRREDIDVAIDASPSSCVISGARSAVEQLGEQWKQDGIQVRMVKTDVPFHSKFLVGLAEPLREALDGSISPRHPTIPLYSTSSQDPRSMVSRDIDYWVANMIQPVLLRNAVEAIAQDGYRAFVEISSHPIVTHSVNETLGEADLSEFVTLPTMLRNQPAQRSIFNTLSKLHCFGVSTEFTRQSNRPWLSDLPGTVWSHQPFWRQVAKIPFEASTSHDPMSNTLLGKRSPVVGTSTVLFQTRLDEDNKPFPGKHPLHGSEIVPAAVLINTFLNATANRSLEDVSLKVPVVVSPARDIQIRLEPQKILITSKLASAESQTSTDSAWLVNTTSSVASDSGRLTQSRIDINGLKKTMTSRLSNTFSIDYLAKVGVPDMGFPWKVLDHIEGDSTMLARVATNPENAPGCNDNWTSILDSATSIASTIFYSEPLLRMPTAIRQVIRNPEANSPKVAYVYCKRVPSEFAVDVIICDEDGTVLVELRAMAFAGIEGEASARTSTKGLIHRLAWVPATYSEEPLSIKRVALFADANDSRIISFQKQLTAKGIKTSTLKDLAAIDSLDEGSIIAHLPSDTVHVDRILEESTKSCMDLANIVQRLITTSSKCKVVTILAASDGDSALKNGPLHGLARIIQSEAPQVFGGVVEVEDGIFPLTSIKYVHEESVVRIMDDVPRVSRLRAFPGSRSLEATSGAQAMFRPDGTYLITGGLGALGLEVAAWMVEQGARRLLLVSRSRLPHRASWSQNQGDQRTQRIQALEKLGASVHVLSVDMSAKNGDEQLGAIIDTLSLPPVSGVVHAAGVLQDQLVEEITADAFEKVLAPKITGAMNLHRLFPVRSLDFFVMFSSCGQLLGFPGQASYASGNAFLDEMAAQRRRQGDNCTSIMWTSWRGLGMAASTDYINAELNARGITDVTKDEAFMAWSKIASLSTDHAVVLRTLELEADDPVPHPILNDIVTRKAAPVGAVAESADGGKSTQARPKSGPELEEWLRLAITKCVATTLSADESIVDPLLALAEMGMDSVMTVQFRSKLQSTLKVKAPPILVWKCPTVNHLVKHFAAELSE